MGLDSRMMQRLELFGYEVEERIGEGGFGIAYKAKQVAQGRTVALKVLADDAEPRAAVRELFIRRAEELARLDHEGVASLLKVHHEASPIFLVMEWVDGQPVTLALNGADWGAKAGAVADICDSLEYAHRRGVVHGNLKPCNLLVGPDGKPRVLDCGLSRLLADDGDLRRHGASGAVGKALYLAPEQVRGEATVGPAADVYSLGVVLYELLTGAPPFAAYGFHRVLDAHLHDAPELPMLRRDDVPEPLQRICLKALEKTPEDRYRSMSEMREDLERYRHGKTVSVRPSYYNNLIETPARGHVAALDRWHDQALITDREHIRLRRAYQGLTRSGLQAVSESRLVHWRVLLLYLGGWLVLTGAVSWLALYYSVAKPPNPVDMKPEVRQQLEDLGLVFWRAGRVLVGLVPALLTNGLWQFFNRRGSYRFAFAAMILGLLSLPFAVAVTVHEIAESLAIAALRHPVNWRSATNPPDQIFDGVGVWLPNWQLFIALVVAVVWGTYVARQSRTSASAAIVGLHFVALYLIGLDFWGLRFLFETKMSYGGLCTLPAAVALVAAGLYAGQKLKRPGQAVPLFAIAMVVAILSSQAIAWNGPKDWEFLGLTDDDDRQIGIGAIEVALGIAYFSSSRYLRDRFPVEAAAAYRVLAWLAPVAFLGGIAIMDWYLKRKLGMPPTAKESVPQCSNGMLPFLGKCLTPWAPVLLASSIIVVLLAARLQLYFYICCGLGFLAYILQKVAFEQPRNWPWPFTILCAGLVVVAVLRWRDSRERVGEDIDDVGELLIRRSRAASSAAGEQVDLLKRRDAAGQETAVPSAR
jgi:serine/threonine protein kinase